MREKEQNKTSTKEVLKKWKEEEMIGGKERRERIKFHLKMQNLTYEGQSNWFLNWTLTIIHLCPAETKEGLRPFG